MHLNIIAFAIPLFVTLMLVEYFLSIYFKKPVFTFAEAIANINVGIAERLSDVFTTGIFYFIFSYIYEHYRLFTLTGGWWQWLCLFIFTDFIWYWYHRLGHEVNILWAAHVVHHQSDDFNYTVSARITVFQSLARGIFWCLLPLIGFSPSATYIMLLVHGAYPFFTHTQMIGKLGILEYFFVTPSHHRVHHSSNPEYLDKNYGDVLIIWDKLFGTFREEKAIPVYGLTKPLESHSFLWQHFHFPMEMWVALRRSNSLAQKLRILFGKPDDIDPAIRPFLEKKLLRRNRNINLNSSLSRYVMLQTIIILIGLFTILLFEKYIKPEHLFVSSLFIIISLISSGAMLEQKRWIFELDIFRIIFLMSYCWMFLGNVQWLLIFVPLVGVISVYYKVIKASYHSLFLSSYEQN